MVDLEKVCYPSMTHRQNSSTVVVLPKLAIEARLKLGWQVGVGARLTERWEFSQYGIIIL